MQASQWAAAQLQPPLVGLGNVVGDDQSQPTALSALVKTLPSTDGPCDLVIIQTCTVVLNADGEQTGA